MEPAFLQDWLVKKFKEIENRWLAAMAQLNEDQLNWRPNDGSNSIANLVAHIRGNVAERISQGILRDDVSRDRDAEFRSKVVGKEQLRAMLRETFAILIPTVERMTYDQFNQTQRIRDRERPNLEVLLQMATHFSEHLGQVFYIAKHELDESYTTTSLPKRKME